MDTKKPPARNTFGAGLDALLRPYAKPLTAKPSHVAVIGRATGAEASEARVYADLTPKQAVAAFKASLRAEQGRRRIRIEHVLVAASAIRPVSV